MFAQSMPRQVLVFGLLGALHAPRNSIAFVAQPTFTLSRRNDCNDPTRLINFDTAMTKSAVLLLDHSTTSLKSNRFNRDMEENSRRKAQGGAAETAAGAILGGLLLGPFGALFGAQLGASVGSQRAVDRARKEEMERMGITPDMLQMAEECGVALERAIEGLKASRDSLQTQQSLARRFDEKAKELYQKATTALASNDESQARQLLFERTRIQEKLKEVLKSCADERKRVEIMEQNVEAIEQRAMEVEALLNRSISAKAVQDNFSSDFALSREDPLLQKFRDLGLD